MRQKKNKKGDTRKIDRQDNTSDGHVSFSSQAQRDNPLVQIALIIILILVVYSNSFTVPFQWDEQTHIVDNPVIKDLHYFVYPSKARGFEYYNFFISRYVPVLTFALNYWINGLDVAGYHVVNNAIHPKSRYRNLLSPL